MLIKLTQRSLITWNFILLSTERKIIKFIYMYILPYVTNILAMIHQKYIILPMTHQKYKYNHKSNMLFHILHIYLPSELVSLESVFKFRAIDIYVFSPNLILCNIRSIGNTPFLKRLFHCSFLVILPSTDTLYANFDDVLLYFFQRCQQKVFRQNTRFLL